MSDESIASFRARICPLVECVILTRSLYNTQGPCHRVHEPCFMQFICQFVSISPFSLPAFQLPWQ